MTKIQALAITNPDVAFILQENENLKEENARLGLKVLGLEYLERKNTDLEKEAYVDRNKIMRLEQKVRWQQEEIKRFKKELWGEE